MSSDLAVIDAEVDEDQEFEEGEEYEDDDVEVIEPLSKAAAKALDKKIRAKSNKVNAGVEKVETDLVELLELLQEAQDGLIHKGLGLKSWTAWYKDAVQFQASDSIERKVLASIMSGKGMSTRAIAGALNTSQSTITRDLSEDDESDDSGDEDGSVTGLDGKTYNKSKGSKEDSAEEPPAPKEAPISEEFKENVYQIINDAEAFRELVFEDDRFPKARKRIAKLKIVGEFRDAIEQLDEILTAIVGEDEE